MKRIVSDFDGYQDGVYYEGIIPREFVMGYFANDTLEFTANENFSYGTDAFYESVTYR